MRSYVAFVKKEWREQIRNYQLFIMAILFTIIGFLNPITAKIMPTIMADLLPKSANIKIPDATALDSWAQFFKNVPQLGLVVLVILYSGLIAKELSHGTLILSLTKGLSRKNVILAKFTVAGSIWSACLWGCSLLTYGYTAILFQGKQPAHIFVASSLVWLFGLLILALLLLFGVWFGKSTGALLGAGVFLVVCLLINFVKSLQDYNPLNLVTKNMSLVEETIKLAKIMPSIWVSVIALIICLIAAIGIFQKKAL